MTDQTRMTQERLDEIRARVEAATPGEWVTEDLFPWGIVIYAEPTDDHVCSELDSHNADLIAHAPADLAALLAEVARLKQIILDMQTGEMK